MHSGDTDIQLRRIVTRSCIDSVRRWMLPVGREHRKLVVAPWQTPPHSTPPSLFPLQVALPRSKDFVCPFPGLPCGRGDRAEPPQATQG